MKHEIVPKEWLDSVEVVRGDITNPKSISLATEGISNAIHLVAKIGDWGEEDIHHKVTVEGSRLLFEAALRKKIRVTLASSIVVYGEALQNEICFEERDFGRFYGPYSRSKQEQENLARNFEEKGMLLSIVRPANVYGPGCEPWVHGVVKQLEDRLPSLISGGHQNAGLVYVDNVVDILIKASKNPAALGQCYNIADSDGVSWNQYVHDLSRFSGSPKPKSIPKFICKPITSLMELTWKLLGINTRPPLTHEALNLVTANHRIPISKAREELGYKPLFNYREGIEKVGQYLTERSKKAEENIKNTKQGKEIAES